MPINCASGQQLAFLATTIASALTCNMEVDDIDVLGNLFQTIGQSMSLIASQKSRCESTIEAQSPAVVLDIAPAAPPCVVLSD